MQTVKQMMHHIEAIDTMTDFRNETLRSFDRLFGLEQSIFWLCGSAGEIYNPIAHNIKPRVLCSYENYKEYDFLLPARVQPRLSAARVLRLDDVVTWPEYESSPFYQEFMEPIGAYHEMGVYLLSGDRLIGGISFTEGWSNPFENETILEKIELLSYYVSMKLQTLLQTDSLGELDLTPGERKVCLLLQKGYTNQEIADTLFVTIHTVKKHLQNIYSKNKIANRTDLVARLFERNKAPLQ